MALNLDLAALRALVAVAEMGGVTRAAAQLNLTQSAVSLQIKRLEETLDQCLIERAGRGVALTLQGEQLVGYARRLLALNDQIVARMSPTAPDTEIRLGVPCDLLHLHVPAAMRAFGAARPDVRVVLLSEPSAVLREQLDSGAIDIILTTERDPGPGAETLATLPLVWIGAPGGRAWHRRPLPLGTVFGCAFTRAAIEALSGAGFDWSIAADASKVAVDGSVAADLAIHMMLRGTIPAGFEIIDHRGALPPLPPFLVNLYVTQGPRRAHAEPLAEALRQNFADPDAIAAE